MIMDLYSGLPYWIAKNPLYDYFNPLAKDHKTDVLIIGSGITGALIAHELCKSGIKCTIVDKRNVSMGSSIASTSLLQYEIDTPLHKLSEMVGEHWAVESYKASLQAIEDIENVFKEINYNPDFQKTSSIFYASSSKDLKIIDDEYQIRRKYSLPVEYLNKRELRKSIGIKAPGALKNDVSAKMDCYAASTHIIDYYLKKKKLKVFTNTKVVKFHETTDGYTILTEDKKKIKCKYLVIAAGFESGQFLPKQVMKLLSTYALISEPIDKKYFWAEESLIWETRQPYLYVRTCGNRIMVGGEDIDFNDPVKRDRLLRKKVSILEEKFHRLFPDIPLKTDMAWCGTFSSTKDGLPYIGFWPEKNRLFFALGYGGNGITFSMIAAQVLKNKLTGVKDARGKIFGFDRN